jgi:RES domain-containing protein
MVYFADHPALSVLEVRVHLDLPLEDLPDDYVLLRVALPDDVATADEMPATPRQTGDAWLEGLSTAVVRVPSALVPRASNLLLNPLFTNCASAAIDEVIPFRFDERLWRQA